MKNLKILLFSLSENQLENVITIDTSTMIEDRWKSKPKEIYY